MLFLQEAVEFYEANNDSRYLEYKQKMLSVINKPSVRTILTAKNENNPKNEKNIKDVNKGKSLMKTKTENMLNLKEEEYIKKKEIINNSLKSQLDDIRDKLENRKFKNCTSAKGVVTKKNSLFLGKDKDK